MFPTLDFSVQKAILDEDESNFNINKYRYRERVIFKIEYAF